MISLQFFKPWRSILDLEKVELPDFVVLTGVNGSGKTHLLEAIQKGMVKIDNIPASDQTFRMFNWTNLIPNQSAAADPIQLSRERLSFIQQTCSVLAKLKNQFMTPLYKVGLTEKDIENILRGEGEHKKIYDVGIKDYNYHELKNLSEKDLQKIVDNVCALVGKFQAELSSFKGSFQTEYLCGKKLSLPVWMQNYRGHDLERSFREAMKNAGVEFVITKNECGELRNMLVDRLPDFIPTDLVTIFKDLQK